jgi:hypothetical protein
VVLEKPAHAGAKCLQVAVCDHAAEQIAIGADAVPEQRRAQLVVAASMPVPRQSLGIVDDHVARTQESIEGVVVSPGSGEGAAVELNVEEAHSGDQLTAYGHTGSRPDPRTAHRPERVCGEGAPFEAPPKADEPLERFPSWRLELEREHESGDRPHCSVGKW